MKPASPPAIVWTAPLWKALGIGSCAQVTPSEEDHIAESGSGPPQVSPYGKANARRPAGPCTMDSIRNMPLSALFSVVGFVQRTPSVDEEARITTGSSVPLLSLPELCSRAI